MKSKVAILLACALTLSMLLSACSGGGGNAGGGSGDDPGGDATAPPVPNEPGDREAIGAAMSPVTLNIRLMNEVRNIDMIIEEYKTRVADDPILSKVDLNIGYVTGGDYRDKLNMLMVAQDEDIDLMFCGAWHGLSTYAGQGMFADLTPYFENPAFPGLLAGFAPDYIGAAKTYLENGEAKVYSIPLAESFLDMRGFNYREDLRVKYGIPEITNDDIFEQFLETVLANEPDIAFGFWAGNFHYAWSPYYSAAHDNVFAIEPFGANAPMYVGVSADGTQVLGVVAMGDMQENFNQMPTGYQYDFLKEYHVERLRWAPYSKLTQPGVTNDTPGYTAGGYGTVTELLRHRRELSDNADAMDIWPDASLGLYISEADQRNQLPGAIVSEMKSNNFLVVPEWSKNVDATMYFLDWMFGSKENHDLFQFGIEGVHWEAVGDDAFRPKELPEAEQFIMPGYSFTWNPNYIRYSEDVLNDPVLLGMYEYQNDISSYVVSPISGFNFNTDDVATQIANISALTGELRLVIAAHGDQTEAVIDEWYSDAVAVGLDDVKDEIVRQLQLFLDMKNA